MKREKVSISFSIIFILSLSTICHHFVSVTATGRPVRCSICSSAPNREGFDCIESPQKFVQECNIFPGEKEFNGCWKIEQFVLYDGPEPEPVFNPVQIYNNTIVHNDDDTVEGDSVLKVNRSDDKNTDESIQRALRKRHHRIIRKCAYHEGADGNCINRGASGWSQNVCWCRKEGCNSTTFLHPSITLVSILFFFLFLVPLILVRS